MYALARGSIEGESVDASIHLPNDLAHGETRIKTHMCDGQHKDEKPREIYTGSEYWNVTVHTHLPDPEDPNDSQHVHHCAWITSAYTYGGRIRLHASLDQLDQLGLELMRACAKARMELGEHAFRLKYDDILAKIESGKMQLCGSAKLAMEEAAASGDEYAARVLMAQSARVHAAKEE